MFSAHLGARKQIQLQLPYALHTHRANLLIGARNTGIPLLISIRMRIQNALACVGDKVENILFATVQY